jgi:hypothetical protein
MLDMKTADYRARCPMCGRWVPIEIATVPTGLAHRFTVHYSIEHAAIGCAGLTEDPEQEGYGLAILLSARRRPDAGASHLPRMRTCG